METISTQQTQPQTSSGIRRKSSAVEPFLRLQNKATSWSSKSESDLTSLGRAEEKPDSYSAVSNTLPEGACDLSEMQNSNLSGIEVQCKAITRGRDIRERIVVVSDASAHFCVHGASKSKRRNSSSASLDGFTASAEYLNEHEYTVMKARPRMRKSVTADVCNEYAVPFPVAKPKSGSVVEYGNIVINEDTADRKLSISGNLSAADDKESSVSSIPTNICHCVGKQKFIEGHYKATYLCDIKTDGKNEDAAALEQIPHKDESERAKHTNASLSTIKDTLKQQIIDEEAVSETKKKYGSLPIPSARDSVGTSFEDSENHIYSNFMTTNCLVHKYKVHTSNTEEENLYGNCTCGDIKGDVPDAEDEHQIRRHSRRPSRTSSTSSSVIRSAAKRTRETAPAKLSELCIRVLINSVSSHSYADISVLFSTVNSVNSPSYTDIS
jgi:hypothetical protein